MTTHRPTTLRLAVRHCARAVDHYENLRAQFRDLFGTGIAGHAVLEHLGLLAVDKGSALTEDEVRDGARSMVDRLLQKGRTFDGNEEPPLPAGQIMEGTQLATRWATEHPLSHTAKYELGVGFTRDWRPCGYGAPEARFRLIFDVLDRYEESDEESASEGVVHTDYKSAWSTSADDLYSIQMKAQTVGAWTYAGIFSKERPAFIRRELINLRTQESISNTLWMDENGIATVEAWKRELTAHMDALDAMPSPRPARPGHGCMGCPWVMSCEAAKTFLSDAVETVPRPTDPVHLARAFCVADARRDALFDLVKKASDEGPIDVGDGVLVGTMGKPGVAPEPKALRTAWDEWSKRGGDAEGFTAALEPGVQQLRALAKVMHPRKRDEQDELFATWTYQKTERRFGIYPKPQTLIASSPVPANDTEHTDAA